MKNSVIFVRGIYYSGLLSLGLSFVACTSDMNEANLDSLDSDPPEVSKLNEDESKTSNQSKEEKKSETNPSEAEGNADGASLDSDTAIESSSDNSDEKTTSSQFEEDQNPTSDPNELLENAAEDALEKSKENPETETAETSPEPKTTRDSYTVVAGDSLGKISMDHYGSPNYWEAIATANNIDNPDLIEVGQKLVLPPKNSIKPKVYRASKSQEASPKVGIEAEEPQAQENIETPQNSSSTPPEENSMDAPETI